MEKLHRFYLEKLERESEFEPYLAVFFVVMLAMIAVGAVYEIIRAIF